MSKKNKNSRDSWGFKESILTFIPGNSTFGTMRSRQARQGVLFILPFIIGFLFFMVRPMVTSIIMSLCNVTLIPGKGYEMSFMGFRNYQNALGVDPNYNQYLVEEISRMGINGIATLVMSFVIAVEDVTFVPPLAAVYQPSKV